MGWSTTYRIQSKISSLGTLTFCECVSELHIRTVSRSSIGNKSTQSWWVYTRKHSCMNQSESRKQWKFGSTFLPSTSSWMANDNGRTHKFWRSLTYDLWMSMTSTWHSRSKRMQCMYGVWASQFSSETTIRIRWCEDAKHSKTPKNQNKWMKWSHNCMRAYADSTFNGFHVQFYDSFACANVIMNYFVFSTDYDLFIMCKFAFARNMRNVNH